MTRPTVYVRLSPDTRPIYHGEKVVVKQSKQATPNTPLASGCWVGAATSWKIRMAGKLHIRKPHPPYKYFIRPDFVRGLESRAAHSRNQVILIDSVTAYPYPSNQYAVFIQGYAAGKYLN